MFSVVDLQLQNLSARFGKYNTEILQYIAYS